MDKFSALDKAVITTEQISSLPRYEPLPEKSFPAASLRAWMSLAHACGVGAVPAHYLGSVPIDPLLHFDSPVDGTKEALNQVEEFNQSLHDAQMLRWDCCAPWGVKTAIGSGRLRPSGQEAFLDPGDTRAFDLIYGYPARDIPVFSRPWLPAMVFKEHPVEFRVFVDDGKVVAVSNYYPQRSLPDHEKVRRLARLAMQMAGRMIDKAMERSMHPWMPGVEQASQPTFSASLDFLVLTSANLLFLEGGPGFGYGAHPCCFVKHVHGMTGADPVQGLRLAIGQPPIDLADI